MLGVRGERWRSGLRSVRRAEGVERGALVGEDERSRVHVRTEALIVIVFIFIPLLIGGIGT